MPTNLSHLEDKRPWQKADEARTGVRRTVCEAVSKSEGEAQDGLPSLGWPPSERLPGWTRRASLRLAVRPRGSGDRDEMLVSVRRFRIQFLEQSSCLYQIARLQPLGEPVVERRENGARFFASILPLPQPCEAHRRPQLEAFGALRARDFDGFSIRLPAAPYIPHLSLLRKLSRHAIDLRLVHAVVGPVDEHQRFIEQSARPLLKRPRFMAAVAFIMLAKGPSRNPPPPSKYSHAQLSLA